MQRGKRFQSRLQRALRIGQTAEPKRTRQPVESLEAPFLGFEKQWTLP